MGEELRQEAILSFAAMQAERVLVHPEGFPLPETGDGTVHSARRTMPGARRCGRPAPGANITELLQLCDKSAFWLAVCFRKV
jgi:hypothetical protein